MGSRIQNTEIFLTVYRLYTRDGKFRCLKEFLDYLKLQENYQRRVQLAQ